jgi:hypothetical protein
MAEFSEEYCEIYNPGLDSDFSIIDIFAQLKQNQSMDLICEGFGIIKFYKIAEEQYIDTINDTMIKWSDFQSNLSRK